MTSNEQATSLKKFQSKAREVLREHLEEHGQLVYSTAATICQESALMIMGLNPGQDPALNQDHISNTKIGPSINALTEQNESLVLAQAFLKPKGDPHDVGEAPYQVRVKWLLDFLQQPDALVTNLIFFQTRREAGLANLVQAAEACWPVHLELLGRTKPKVILVFGASAGSFVRKKLDGTKHIVSHKSGHGDWQIRSSVGEFQNRPILILQIPHVSSYRPNRPQLEKCFEDLKVKEQLDASIGRPD